MAMTPKKKDRSIQSHHRSGRKLWLWDSAWWGLPLCKSALAISLQPAFYLFEDDFTDERNREKLLKMDAKRREYDIVVIGEESHLAYNRVGLTSFFQHRKVENLYLNPQEWVCFYSSYLGS